MLLTPRLSWIGDQELRIQSIYGVVRSDEEKCSWKLRNDNVSLVTAWLDLVLAILSYFDVNNLSIKLFTAYSELYLHFQHAQDH